MKFGSSLRYAPPKKIWLGVLAHMFYTPDVQFGGLDYHIQVPKYLEVILSQPHVTMPRTQDHYIPSLIFQKG
jgi:hypothetical protein